jgi:membrane fusion protein (multidrug efflux system)
MLRTMKGKLGKGVALALAITGMLALAGCGQKQQAAATAVPVKTMQVIKRDTPTVYDFTGFVEAQQKVTVMSKVSGRITSKNFNGGDFVTAGQVLFTIDSRSAKADALNAEANLASARSELIRLQRDEQRYKTLYAQNAVSKQTYDQAVASAEQAQAAVNAKQALLENAQITLGETDVVAPISGRIDTSDLAVGNYVNVGSTTMATITSIDPVRVKFSMSENEYLRLAKSHNDKGAASLENLTLKLSDGSTYPEPGTVEQVDNNVSDGTGTLTLKARFANASHLLLPGMFAKLEANAGTTTGAMLIPQRSVKEMLYKKFVYTVDKDNKVDMKEVKLGARVGRLWLVESGLKGDETIVVEGIQKVNKGSTVKPQAITEADLDTGESK